MSAEKLHHLRAAMRAHGLDGYLQPVHDQYLSEYPPACNRRVAWLSGFTGSAGSVAVLADSAALFTDGRYTLQARTQIDLQQFTPYNSGEVMPEQWLLQQAAPGARIGYDAQLYTREVMARMQAVLDAPGITLVACENLVDGIWHDRPPAPATPVFIHELRHSGETPDTRRGRIGALVAQAGADVALLTAPDAVNWLLCIRARDVESTPLALAFALLHQDGRVQFYLDESRCDAAVNAHLGDAVTLRAPAMLAHDLMALHGQRVLCDPRTTPLWFVERLEQAGAQLVEKPDPCLLPKAVKNPVELAGIRAAHIRDGVAVSRLLCWLDAQTGISEIDVAEKLLAFRAEDPAFVEPSFATIAGSGPNGAIVHYHATPASNRQLQSGELFLLDSGGQYPDGTTDITRTVPVGVPDAEQKDRFTRVLKGHIAIATARFPQGTAGSQLDALARQFLWQAGLDYDHGTGHGVGHFLGVHEGPQRISKRGGDSALLPGMVVSNEPGYYKTGAYGIRIENLVAVIEQPAGGGDKPWLGFESLTCVPMDMRLIDLSLLDTAEQAWLDNYHRWVFIQLSPLVDAPTRAWLEARCRPVGAA